MHINALSIVAANAYQCLANLCEGKLFSKHACIGIGMGAYGAIGNMGSTAGSWFYSFTDGPQNRKGLPSLFRYGRRYGCNFFDQQYGVEGYE